MNEIRLPVRQRQDEELLTPVALSRVDNVISKGLTHDVNAELRSHEDVLQVLKSKPTLEELERCLEFLDDRHDIEGGEDVFHIRLLGPKSSPIIFVLVNDIVPSYWPTMSTEPRLRGSWRLLIQCLRSIAGIGAVTARLKALCHPFENHGLLKTDDSLSENLEIALQLLECLLHGDKTLDSIWTDVFELETKEFRRSMVMDQLSSLLASGSVLSTAAEASTKSNEASRVVTRHIWVGDGRLFASWLGRNVMYWSMKIKDNDNTDAAKVRDRFVTRCQSLGYNDQIVDAIFGSLLEGKPDSLHVCRDITFGISPGLQPSFLNSLLRNLATRTKQCPEVSFIQRSSALLHELTGDSVLLQQTLIKWLTEFPGANVAFDLSLYRAVIASLSKDVKLLKEAHKKSLARFGSKLKIKQDPILQQEKQAQVLLLITGILFSKGSQFVKEMKHSSLYLEAISNRLAASSNRAQFLGMVVGTAISDLIDEGDTKLVFSNAEVDGEDGKFYKSLIRFHDQFGSISDLGKGATELPAQTKQAPKSTNKTPKSHPKKITEVKPKIVAIEEISDSEEESDDDLPVYAKPDSDEEDEDDDPTLINRNKPIAPVYIRALIASLHDTENFDRHRLAIETAAKLIRRKTNFGTEVTDHAEELATLLVGLKDDDDNVENYQRLRLQAMVAVVVAKPEEMGPWFANTFFNGDYSMSQRAIILTTLALAARELAGYKDEDTDMTGANDAPSFPTKRLPPGSEAMFRDKDKDQTAIAATAALPIARLSGRLERGILQPLAASAADAASGPNALKVRTFSSRLDPVKQAARTRTIPNKLARLVADAFFFPLTSRWRALLDVRGHGHGGSSVFSTPFLLAQFVRTLALVISAAGAGTLSLPAMTTELWALLLGLLRANKGEIGVTNALLVAFLALLELNMDRARDVALDHADELAATRDWVAGVLDDTRGGGGGGGNVEEERVRTLAAAVMIKADELVERYRRELLGPLAGTL